MLDYRKSVRFKFIDIKNKLGKRVDLMTEERLVVVGGNAAGLSAASKARRINPDMEITVFERQDYVSFGLCGLPYYIEGKVEDLEDLIAIAPEEFREKRDVDVRLNHEVLEIDTQEKFVVVENEEGEEIVENYDKLVISTGAHAKTLGLEGVDLEGVFTLHWLEDGRKIKDFIDREDPKKAVLTAGYIGLEMAEALREQGMDVTVVAKRGNILPMVDQEIAEPLEKELTENGVEILVDTKVTGFEGNEEIENVLTDDGDLSADIAILSIGAGPTVDVAKETGVEIGDSGAIVVDERMETNVEDVYAAGDCVETNHIVSGGGVNIPLGDTANRMGRVAGENIAGGDTVFPGVLGTAITKVFDLGVARTGLSESEAERSDFDYFSTTIETPSRAFYYPGGSKITIKFVVEEDTGRLLGAQMAGKEGVSQRIDVCASLIYNEMRVQEIQNMDFAYAPPYSPAWDPVQTAAKVASGKL